MDQRLKGHALIIEDEMIIALEIETLLAELGFETFDFADSPAQAFAAATSHRPDLITADVRIVGGTGIEAATAIVAALGPIPVVYVTGNLDMLTGASAVVEKPISPLEFASACQRVCTRST